MELVSAQSIWGQILGQLDEGSRCARAGVGLLMGEAGLSLGLVLSFLWVGCILTWQAERLWWYTGAHWYMEQGTPASWG